ncbi:MAG: hypothetical protein H6933_02615 [Burkholderiaceae bacterium]|nr:hypothetical protein [Burkholderiaceae bacterium]
MEEFQTFAAHQSNSKRGAKELSATQAQALVTTTLHRTLAYGTELLRLEDARRLAEELVAAAGPEARFFSNCDVADELSGVCGWKFMVTAHTFESVLYCVGTNESALLVACDED